MYTCLCDGARAWLSERSWHLAHSACMLQAGHLPPEGSPLLANANRFHELLILADFVQTQSAWTVAMPSSVEFGFCLRLWRPGAPA